ncbi:MAG: proline--tRNA ligase [Oscillospiraceae bacterium]|nr:proline--tRNA ligase [Oscillospiraceae bacterium]MDD4545882.1 proline--tRNA ligase [Oscillospiraceae bacterium]
MADNKNKKMVEAITPMDEDFAKWYTDVVKKAELASYSGVRGCMIVRPYGTALWENIHNDLDTRFKELGHENIMLPMFIPESLLQREKDHVEGFAPEVAWVTHGGDEELPERLCIRPTSETLFCDHYHDIIHSYRDLPKLYNQWCSVVRWEKTTRPFLRTTEFYWQEGHTMHETPREAMDETEQMLGVYADFCEQSLAIPVLKGKKTDKEKFAGAEATYTIEAMMHDGKALQSATSHYFGDGFSKAFEIQFTGRDNTLQYPFQTSWGMSTRIIGAIIMTHGDDNGLVIPPAVAPVQLVIIPIASHKPGVLDAATALKEKLKSFVRVSLDDSDNSAGWKFSEHEMKGVPLRLELGPRDIENNQCVIVRRDNREKTVVSLDELGTKIPELLKAVHDGLYQKALKRQIAMTYSAATMDEMKDTAENKPGFIKAMWCGSSECESGLKENAGVTSRCMPFEQEHISDSCVCCGKKAEHLVVWGKAY